MEGAIRASRAVRAFVVFGFVFFYGLASTYAATEYLPENYFFIAADVNGDRLMDAIAQPRRPESEAAVLLGLGAGDPDALSQRLNAVDPDLRWDNESAVLHAADFNGDRRDDLYLQGRAPGSLQAVLLANDEGRFETARHKFAGANMGFDWAADLRTVISGDFNGNGRADLLMQGRGVDDIHIVIRANGKGALNTTGQSWVDGHLGLRWHGAKVELHAGDFNGDHRTDLLWRRKAGTTDADGEPLVALLLADRAGEFNHIAQQWDEDFLGAEWDPATHDIRIGDINHDGIADIVLYARAANGTHYLVPGRMDGQFREVALRWQGEQSAEQAWAAHTTGSANIVYGDSILSAATTTVTKETTTTSTKTLSTSSSNLSELTVGSTIVAGALPGQAGVSGGSATYNIPIEIPPGRNGMQPSVSLNYSSRGGNGDAGMGWSLSAGSSIHRCPRMKAAGDVANIGVQYNAQDALCLDGQRLVRVSGTHGQGGAEYRTEIESFVRVVIEQGNIAGSTSAVFRVDYSDGSKAYYGGGTNGALAAETQVLPENAPYPLSWQIGRRQDASGNSIIYRYSTFGAGENRLSEILYTNLGTSVEADTRKVKFVWENRPDSSSSYLAGGRTDSTKRLDRIETYVGNTKIREYRLGYAASNPATGRTVLEGITACAFKNGNTYCLTPTSFKWTNEQTGTGSPIGFEPRQPKPIPGWTESGQDTNTATSPYAKLETAGDFDGDGTREILISDIGKPQGYKFAVNIGGTTVFLDDVLSSEKLLSQRPIDLNNDGITDLIGSGTDGEFKFTSWNGSAFAQARGLGVNWGYGQAQFVDFDSDGDADIVGEYDGSVSDTRAIKLYKNQDIATDGSVQFAAPTIVTNLQYYDGQYDGFAHRYHEQIEQVLDLNGDGLADIVTNFPHGTDPKQRVFKRVLIASMGSNGVLSYTSRSALELGVAELDDGTYYRFIDVNGDGLQDLMYIMPSTASAGETATWYVRLNIGATIDVDSPITPMFGPAFNTGISHRTGCVSPDSCQYVRSPMYAKAFFNVDLDGDGSEELLMPAGRLSTYCGKYDVPPSGSNTTEDPAAGEFYCGEAMYTRGLGQYDRSVHQFKILKVSVSSTGAMGASLQSTDVVAALNANVGDLDGDGRTDVWSLPADPGDDFKYLLDDDADKDHIWNSVHVTCPQECAEPLLGFYVQSGKSTPPDFVTSVTNGYGVTTEWEFSPLSSSAGRPDGRFYFAPSGGGRNYADANHYYFTSTMRVVAAMHTQHGAVVNADNCASWPQYSAKCTGGWNTTRYWYREAMYNNQGRGFVGFRAIVEENLASGLKTETVFHQKFPFVSRQESTRTVSGGSVVNGSIAGGKTISEKHWQWNELDPDVHISQYDNYTPTAKYSLFHTVGPVCVVPTRTDSKQYDLSTGNLLSSTSQVSTVEGATSGSACRVVSKTVNSDTVGLYDQTATTTYEYAGADRAAWWLDKLNSTETATTISWKATPTFTEIPSSYTSTIRKSLQYGHVSLRVPTQETVEPVPADAALTLTNSYVYDSWGNRTQTTVSGGAGASAVNARTTKVFYNENSSNGYFPVRTENPLNQSASATFDAAIGKPLSTTSIEGISTVFNYDAFGRNTMTQTANLPAQYTAHSLCNGCKGGKEKYSVTTMREGSPTQTAYHDAYGRVVRTQSEGDQPGTLIHTTSKYDWAGRVREQSEPEYNVNPLHATVTSGYDALGRPLSVTEPSGVTRTFSYHTNEFGAFKAHTTKIDVNPGDSPAFTNVETRTPDGKLVKLIDAIDGSAEYRYDAQGNPVLIQNTDRSLLTAVYNALGQKTTVNDPDMGTWHYGYDVLGNVVQTTDANGNSTYQTYDLLNRMKARQDDEFRSEWTFNTTGCVANLGSVAHRRANGDGTYAAAHHSESYEYDNLCRETARIETIDGTPHYTYTAYNALGQVESVTYPKTVTSNNTAPVASAGADQTVVLGAAITLDASASSDADNGPQPLQYRWQQTDSKTAVPNLDPALRSQTLTPGNPGVYTFEVTAGDGEASDTDTMQANVLPQAPGAMSSTLTGADNNGSTSHDGIFRLTWGASPGEGVTYRVQARNLDATTSWSTFSGCDAAELAARDCAVSNHGDGDWEFRAQALADGLVSNASTSARVLVRRRPGAPLSITVPPSSTTGSYVVEWGAAPTNGAAGVTYKLYESATKGTFGATPIYTDTELRWPISDKWDDQHLYYQVVACNTKMTTVCGGARMDNTGIAIDAPPSPPTGFAAVANDANNHISVTWDEKPNATGYKVWYGTDPGFASYTETDSDYSTCYYPDGEPYRCEDEDFTLSNPADGTWYFKVRACNNSGCGPLTSTASATLAATPAAPPAPSIVADTDNNGTLSLNWTAVDKADYYLVYARKSGASWPASALSPSATTTSYPLTLDDGDWQFRLKACNSGKCSTEGATSATTAVRVRPQVPQQLSVPGSSTDDSATVTWSRDGGLPSQQRYVVESKFENVWRTVFPLPEENHDAQATSLTLSGLTNGSYEFRVKACNTLQSSLCSDWKYGSQTLYIVNGAPREPENVTAIAYHSSDNIVVEWTKPADGSIRSFELEYANNDGFINAGVHSIYGDCGESACTFPSPLQWSHSPSDGTWYYRVSSCNEHSCASAPVVSSTLAARPAIPAPPTFVIESGYTGNVTVSWSRVDLADEYELFQRKDGGSWVWLMRIPETSQTLNRPDGNYEYRLKACNASKCSNYSGASSTAAIVNKPNPPSNLRFSATRSEDGSVSVYWDKSNPSGARSVLYRVQKRDTLSGSSWTTVNTTLTSNTSLAVSGLGNGDYEFRVRAYNGDNTSAYSAYSTSPTNVQVRFEPSAPSSISSPSTATHNSAFTVEWGTASGRVTHYELASSTSNTTPSSGTGVGYTWSSPQTKSAGDHYFWVRACNNWNCGGWRGSALTEVAPATATAPAPVADTDHDGTFEVNWSRVDGADRYYLHEYVNGSWVSTVDHGGNTSSVVTRADGSYAFKVRACGGGNCAGNSPTSSTISITNRPGVPSNLRFSTTRSTNGSVTVYWDAASADGASSVVYLLEQSKNGGSWINANDTGYITGTSKSLSGLADGDYRFRVRAHNGSSTGVYSVYHWVSTAVEVRRTPSVPSSLTVPTSATAGTSYTVSWGSSSGTVTRYELWNNWQNTGPYSLTYSGTNRSVSQTAGNAGTERFYWVRACNDWNCSGYRGPSRIYFTSGGGGGLPMSTGPNEPMMMQEPSSTDDGGTTTTSDSGSIDGGISFVPSEATPSPLAGEGGSASMTTPHASSRRSGIVKASHNRSDFRAMPPMRPADFQRALREGRASQRAAARAVKTGLSSTLATTTSAAILEDPQRLTVTYRYTATGHLEAVQNAADPTRDLWRAEARTARGQVMVERFANGVVTDRAYELDTGRATAIDTSSPSGSSDIQDWEFLWSNLGNATSRTDNVIGMSETFDYDKLNRLTATTLTFGGVTGSPETYTYGAAGNLESKGNWSYTYGEGTAGPHAVTSITENGSTVRTLTYDANGNLISRGIDGGSAELQEWYINGLPKTLRGNGNASTFDYAASGKRYKQVLDKTDGTTETTVYVGSLMEIIDKTGQPLEYRHMVYADGTVVVQHTRKANNDVVQRYLHRDHLGSVDAISDSDGNRVVKLGFGAWGERRKGMAPTDDLLPSELAAIRAESHRGYTGHEMLDDVGFVHMNGRAYDPEIGRFLSVDPVFAYPDNPQSLNPYSYVHNNPLSMTDPSGYSGECESGGTGSCNSPGGGGKAEDKTQETGESNTFTVQVGGITGSRLKQDVTVRVNDDGSVTLSGAVNGHVRTGGGGANGATGGAEPGSSEAADEHGSSNSRSSGETGGTGKIRDLNDSELKKVNTALKDAGTAVQNTIDTLNGDDERAQTAIARNFGYVDAADEGFQKARSEIISNYEKTLAFIREAQSDPRKFIKRFDSASYGQWHGESGKVLLGDAFFSVYGGFGTIIHEFGHKAGLTHPGNWDPGMAADALRNIAKGARKSMYAPQQAVNRRALLGNAYLYEMIATGELQ